MNFLSRLFHSTPSNAASQLAQHGAKVRKERERAHIRRVADELREQLGMQPVNWRRRS